MAKRITVVVSQGQSLNPAKRKLEEDLVAELLFESGVEVTVIPNLYDLAPDGTGMLCLQGIAGDMIVLSWLFPRAAHWTLDRNGIRGQVGQTLLAGSDDDEEDDDEEHEDREDEDQKNAEADSDGKERVIDHRELPRRKIYCLDLRAHPTTAPYLAEIRRICAEASTQTVDLLGWIGGAPRGDQFERFLDPSGSHHASGSSPGPTGGGPLGMVTPTPAEPSADSAAAASESNPAAPTVIAEQPARRWYPVIDFSRCTNCMECIDFCLFGVYGVDKADTILVEQPDNCRKGCPACSRVCPENAIIFPQHKTPAIAGSEEAVTGLKIDLSALFGGGNGQDAVSTAVAERDEQLLLAGRGAVGASVGIPKRQSDKPQGPKDDLDKLMDALDDLDL